MNKKILLNFLKDHLSLAIAFFLNSLFLIIFFQITTSSNVEILYPSMLSLFVFIALIIFKWIKYYRFNSQLSNCAHNINYELETGTCEQKEISRTINEIHAVYSGKISSAQLENQNKNYFLSQWIHNMKTPVSVIDLVIQRIISGETEVSDAVNSIKEENNKLLNNLEQILSLYRLEDFSRDYIPEAIDLAAAVKKLINSKKTQFIYSNVFPKLEVLSHPHSDKSAPSGASDLTDTSVLTDTKWNELMLDQIISNAIKYSSTPDTVKNIYFTIEKNEDFVILKIRDDGIGIPQYDINRVFEPFFTGENGRKYKNSTGIGLYICAAIAEKLGHRISLKSEPGKGTEVTISYKSHSAF